MEVRTVVSRLVLGVALTGVAALIVFVGVPWLTAPAPEPLVLPPQEIVAQALGRPAGQGLEWTEGMLLREEPPEHPVLGLTAWVSEKEANQAETGELPAQLSADQVAGAMSGFVRVASAPEVDWEEDDRESDKDVERVGPASQGVTEEREPEVAAPQEQEAAPAGDAVDGLAAGGETAAPVVEAPKSDFEAGEERAAVRDQTSLMGDEEPTVSPVKREAAMQEGPDGAEASGIPLSEPGSSEPGNNLTAADMEMPEDAPATSEAAVASGGTRQRRGHEAVEEGKPEPVPPPRLQGIAVPHSLRGVMGYRLPLVSRQEVPDQVVSGVLIPAHTTYVILRQGEWELVGLSAQEIEILRRAAERRQGEELKGIR